VPPTVTPSRLALARRLRGLTQTALACEIGVSPAAISQFEAGSSTPSAATLERLVVALKVAPAFLGRTEVREDARPFFRSLVRVPAAERDRAHAFALALADVVAEFDSHLELPRLRLGPLTEATTETTGEEIEICATTARSGWGIPGGPIANVVAMAEARGVVVAAVGDFHAGIDAFSLRVAPRPVVVLCSDKGVATRRRFDMAHELGHLALHEERAEDPSWQEQQAHRFASALLMPADEVIDDLPRRGDDLRRLEGFARDWGVSMQAALMRARDLGVLDHYEHARGMRRLASAGWRTKEPVEVGPPERPRLALAAVAALAEGGLSLQLLAENVGLPSGRLKRMLSLPEAYDDARAGDVIPLSA
jgi:Zn-dependent peptidase ImmA (M78 family)/transcriptional regulator with XRE-family HTH domain